MRFKLAATGACAAIGLILAGTAVAAPATKTVPLLEVVPVNIVLVGYEPSQVSRGDLMRELPHQYRPVVRSRLWYGVTEELGIHYTYRYDVTYTDTAWENAFFGQLSALATPAARTPWQQLYNDQEGNVLEVGQNHFIDAPTVEKWLIDNAPRGVDTRRNTIFFVNWYGRPDFKFHVYTKLGEADPDTGNDFGQFSSRKMIAWGGTTPDDEETGLGSRGVHRVWFYDLSAGPEAWTDNWNVDEPDLDGDGEEEYRMPPVWEYAANGYRSPSALGGDLGKVARYVGVNLLFTPSPLYPPYLTPPRQPGAINIDLNTYEGWPGVNASEEYATNSLLLQEVGEVHRVPHSLDNQDLALTGKAEDCFIKWFEDDPCYPQYPYPGVANLFVDAALKIDALRDDESQAETYEVVHMNYATGEDFPTPLGFADDNWIDGTQSGVFNFLSPGIADFGYGLTTTQIHEHGHHIALSHPHDGWDSQTGTDYGPSGPFYFAWSGDEVNSMMSYIDVNWDFSQFDRDNMNRWQAAAYLRNAEAIEQSLKGRERIRALGDLVRAKLLFLKARLALLGHNYPATFDYSKAGYEAVRAGAAKAGVQVKASDNGWTLLPEVSASAVAGRLVKLERSYSYDASTHEHRFRR